MYTIGMRGFTLVELLISVAIFSLITGVVVYNHSKFSSDLIVTNLAYQVALSIRQAQVYGLSVRGATSGSGQTFNAGYGVHFDSSSNQKFYFFADIANKKQLCSNSGVDCTSAISACLPTDGCLEQITIPGGNTIDRFCIVADDSIDCPAVGNPSMLDMTFKRPDPDASFNTRALPSQIGTVAKIYVKSSQGKQKTISVNQSGQISIK